MSIKINKQLLIDLIGGYSDNTRFEVVDQTISDTSRWSIYYDCTIVDKETGKFYDASYKEGATEMQDESPFEYDDTDADGNLELDEVEPYVETIIRYKKIPNDQDS